ncbi:MAG: hypothetical protein KatS3mg103_0202 [Phycisphaerales bacterium]|nr:MAG: hypothetical protein KatS3mg103_0202 [Phycisphaerales bacterium]
MEASAQAIVEHLLPFWLVAARLGGLFLFAPVLASQLVLRQVRVLLLVMLTAALYPAVAAGGVQAPPLEIGSLALVLLGEVLIGLAIGLLATLPLVAIQIAGSVVSYKLGLALAQVYNPEFDAQSEVVGQLLYLMGLALFVQVGGLEHMVVAVMGTFDAIPPGMAWLDDGPVDLLAAMLDSAMVVGLRIAMPVLVLATLASLAMGVLMRTIPQINIMTVGFAIQILLGLAVLAVSVYAIGDVAQEAVVEAFGQIDLWVRSMGVGPEATLNGGGDG